MVDAQAAISITRGGNATEEAFFNRIFPERNSGMRFNFDNIREFLHDPLIAIIATDLTADENLDNIEMVLKRIGREKSEKSSSVVEETTSGVHKFLLLSKESTEEATQYETSSGEISSEHISTIHSIPNLCREILWREPQIPEPFLLPGLHCEKRLVWRMLQECFCTELLFYIIH
ncbi:unnamed protein product [Cercopithifilaria johnstoni]|uniref:Uncharacterized protein n=1 Tax=Cercopithifilaria johnstoni TaxID=2874296 RepID=A0A8J2Q0V8_9BILA|nr:unnamed protein product [Cercopithifilaria johnstoni]